VGEFAARIVRMESVGFWWRGRASFVSIKSRWSVGGRIRRLFVR